MNRDEGDVDVASVHARLADAAALGQAVEVILVVRGKVRPVRTSDGAVRWRMRVAGDHVLTFRADAVVAATPLPPSRARRDPDPD